MHLKKGEGKEAELKEHWPNQRCGGGRINAVIYTSIQDHENEISRWDSQNDDPKGCRHDLRCTLEHLNSWMVDVKKTPGNRTKMEGSV